METLPTSMWAQFTEVFQDHFPTPAPMESLPSITGSEILKVAKRMKDRAGGPDGLLPRHLTYLPEPALDRLAQIFTQCENLGKWPTQVRHWKVCFLSKATAQHGSVAGLGDVRPISIGPTAYPHLGQHATPTL